MSAPQVLKAYRKRHGRGAYARLAERAGMPSCRISELAHGKVKSPRPETALRIAAASEGEFTAAELLGLTDATVPTIDAPSTTDDLRSEDAAE